MSREEEDINEGVESQEKPESYEDNLQPWTDSLEELSEIEKAFGTNKLHEKTILDIGTYGIKPLYIALKYEPSKIIGINDGVNPYGADIEQNSKLFVETEIKFYDCSFFNNVKLEEILKREKITKFDFVLLSKILHHLRTGECIAKKRNLKHCCKENEKSCIYRFDEQEIFTRLLELGKRLIVYEAFLPGTPDNDKVRGRGGYFTFKEWKRILGHIAENYSVEMIQPLRCTLDNGESENVNTILRQVDCICFYVELKEK